MACESFIGNYLSLDCGPVLGTFQGEVSSVCKSGQTISLKNAFRNGVKYGVPEVTMRASDIKDLKILKTSADIKKEAEKNREIIKAVSNKSKSETVNGDGISHKETSKNKVNGDLSKSSLTAAQNMAIPGHLMGNPWHQMATKQPMLMDRIRTNTTI